jgi:DNA-binding transcriptional MerR regulator
MNTTTEEHILGQLEIPATEDALKSEEVLFFDDVLKNDLSQIPDKMAFKIGEVAELLGIKTYVLRYWETEFDALKPKKSNHNQRMYSRRDVEMAFFIKKLLYKDRFSIEGARKALKKLKTEAKKEKSNMETNQIFQETLSEMKLLLKQIQILKLRFE